MRFIEGLSEVQCSIALQAATAAAVVRRPASSKPIFSFIKRLKYTPVPSGEKKLRPDLPRPDVWFPATATDQPGRSSAFSFSHVLVEGMELKTFKLNSLLLLPRYLLIRSSWTLSFDSDSR